MEQGEEGRVTFADFARAHGLMVDSITAGRWVRVPTVDHPRKRNGAYKLLGSIGWVQNHATMTEPVQWTGADDIDTKARARDLEIARRDTKRRQERAALKASAMLGYSEMKTHPYLAKKGFPETLGHVLDERLLVPMFCGEPLVGCQVIDADGGKKFLGGQRADGATFTIGRGKPVLCEGYATGLSVHAAATALKARCAVVVCFSASNLQRVGETRRDAVVVADNDASETGAKVAKATGLPWWMPPDVGHDFNDFHQQVGLFRASQALRGLLYGRPMAR